MNIADFYNSPTITDAFGRTRVYDTIRHIKTVWPGFLPEYQQKVNCYHAAWLLFILCHSKHATRQAVQEAILEGRELKREGQLFITYLGDLLCNPEEIVQSIKNVFVFYGADNCVQVTHQDGNVKIFQGDKVATTVRRAAIMDFIFLADVCQMLMPFEEENLNDAEFEFDEELHIDPREKE